MGSSVTIGFGVSCASSQQQKEENKKSQITPTPKGMGLSARRSGGGGAAQGHPNQSSGARSTTAKKRNAAVPLQELGIPARRSSKSCINDKEVYHTCEIRQKSLPYSTTTILQISADIS